MTVDVIDKDNNTKSMECGEYIGKGLFGQVFKYGDNECIKVYNNIIEPEKSIDNFFLLEMLNFFNVNEFNNIIKINELFFKDNKTIGGYTMPYFKKSDLNLAFVNPDYIINAYLQLRKLVVRLSAEGVLMNDLNAKNVIVTDEDIKVIDPDFYMFKKKNVYEENTKRLLYTLDSLIRDSLCKSGIPARALPYANYDYSYYLDETPDRKLYRIARYKNLFAMYK